MEQVPKIVRERLKASAAVVPHPDADMLTAYSERLLPERERTQVLEHLARCGDCRDIVALALPESESVQPALLPSRKSWFAWPALRWGFVAAGIVLVASFGVLQYRKQTKSATMAYRTPVPAVAQERDRQQEPESQEFNKKMPSSAPTAELSKPAENETASLPQALKSDAETPSVNAPVRRDELTPNRPVQGTRTSPYAGALAHGPRVANQMQLNANTQQQNAYSYQAAPPPASPLAPVKQKATTDAGAQARSLSAQQTVEVANAAPPLSSRSDDLQGKIIQNQPLTEQSLNGGQDDAKINPPKPSTAYAPATKMAGRDAAVLGGGLSAAMKAPNARWTINASGALQRSLDQGNTWQDVNVSGDSATAPGMMLAVNKRAKESQDKDAENSKIERSKSASITFRAVSANGTDVWAGGSAGMLYHSIDSGAHWTRVIPSTAGATLTGEVLTVAFTDAQHGRVSTSTSELWSTEDGGQTWQKQ